MDAAFPEALARAGIVQRLGHSMTLASDTDGKAVDAALEAVRTAVAAETAERAQLAVGLERGHPVPRRLARGAQADLHNAFR